MPINTSLYFKTWKTTLCIFSTCTLLASGSAFAANVDDWTGNFAFGLKHTDGGFNSIDFKASLELVHNQDFQTNRPFRHTFLILADEKKTKINGVNVKTRDKKIAQYVLGYYLDKKSHVEATANYIVDSIFNIDAAKIASVEYIHKALDNLDHQLSLGAGLAYVDFAYTDNTSLDGIGAKISYDYKKSLTNKLAFNQKTEFQATSDIQYTLVISGLSYTLTEGTSLALTHEYTKMSSEPPLNQHKKEHFTNLEINFKF
jgi:hypothetical protein